MKSKEYILEDKIFNLEMEQKELKFLLVAAEGCVEDPCLESVYENIYELTKQIQENKCWIQFYKEELKDLEAGEKYDK